MLPAHHVHDRQEIINNINILSMGPCKKFVNQMETGESDIDSSTFAHLIVGSGKGD